MRFHHLPSVFVVLACYVGGAIAQEKPLLELTKKTAPAKTVNIGDQELITSAYEFGVIRLHNILKKPMRLSWNIDQDQNFIPVVRNATGQIVSNGQPFGFARAPRLEQKEKTVEPGKAIEIEAHMLFETVADQHRIPGTYFVRVRFARGTSVWESNEIQVELKKKK